MSSLVEFNGVELDIDVMELTGWELSQIKQRTGFSYKALLEAVREFDGDATRVIFWIAERRHRPELTFDKYQGPTLAFFMAHMSNLTPQAPDDAPGGEGEQGKAQGETETPSTETTGSQPSPSSTTASTEMSTTA